MGTGSLFDLSQALDAQFNAVYTSTTSTNGVFWMGSKGEGMTKEEAEELQAYQFHVNQFRSLGIPVPQKVIDYHRSFRAMKKLKG